MTVILGSCFWVLAAAAVAMLPMRYQYVPGVMLMAAAPVLIWVLATDYGWPLGALALLAFVAMFRNPLRYALRYALGQRPEIPNDPFLDTGLHLGGGGQFSGHAPQQGQSLAQGLYPDCRGHPDLGLCDISVRDVVGPFGAFGRDERAALAGYLPQPVGPRSSWVELRIGGVGLFDVSVPGMVAWMIKLA